MSAPPAIVTAKQTATGAAVYLYCGVYLIGIYEALSVLDAGPASESLQLGSCFQFIQLVAESTCSAVDIQTNIPACSPSRQDVL